MIKKGLELDAAAMAIQLYENAAPMFAQSGDVLIQQGETSSGLYVLLRGKVEAFSTFDDGRTETYPLMTSGSVFGEIGCIRQIPSTASCIARSDAELLYIERDALMKVLHHEPVFMDHLRELATARVEETNRKVARL